MCPDPLSMIRTNDVLLPPNFHRSFGGVLLVRTVPELPGNAQRPGSSLSLNVGLPIKRLL